MATKVYPTIETTGTGDVIIGQVDLKDYELGEYLTKIRDNSEVVYNCLERPVFNKVTLKRHAFTFRLDNRMVYVFIFIDEDFGKHSKDKRKFIQEYVEKRLAWFFSYGIRKTID